MRSSKGEIMVEGREELLKRVQGSEEREMWWWSTCAVKTILEFKEEEREKIKIAEEKQYSLRTAVLVIKYSYA